MINKLSAMIDHEDFEKFPWLHDAIDALAFTDDCDLECTGDFEPDDFGEEDDCREDDDPGEECIGDYPDTGFRIGYRYAYGCLIKYRGKNERIHCAVQKAWNDAKGTNR